MGVRPRRFFFVPVWVYFFVIWFANADTICELQGCNCTVRVAPWKIINCTLWNVQELQLDQLHIPNEAAEIFISGGRNIILGQKSFDQMEGIAIIRLEGMSSLVMEKQSFRNLTTPSLLIQIQNCDDLKIKTGAFENIQSSIEFEITRCKSVSLEETAFGKLSSATFKDIPKLTLASKTFEFKNQGSTRGRHGPVTSLVFDNVVISTVPSHTFFSALALVKFQTTVIGTIEKDAFSPTEIASVLFTNATIDCIHSNAFNSRTLIFVFKIEKCSVRSIESGAITASMTSLTVQHSSVTDIQSGAINSTVATVEISDNNLGVLHPYSMNFRDWNRITFEQNIIHFLHSNAIMTPSNPEVIKFLFKGNEISNYEPGALSFVPELEDRVFIFKDNFFEQTCHCTLDEWIVELIAINVTSKINRIINSTFCRVNDILSECFDLKVGVINMQNFTELVCKNNTIICEPYRGEVKVVNTTGKNLNENGSVVRTDWLTVIIGTSSILVLLAIVTFIVMLIRGSRWLKRKGYFRKIQYIQNEHSNDEENTIETVDEGDKLDISDDLTMELLQDLSTKLDDPLTHQEACEMIEQLYQKYIHNSGFENNNQHDDDTHLYEELGNLQKQEENGPRSILKIMEEKFNTHFEDIDADDVTAPPIVGEYSEPSDAAVHLYSEVKQSKDESENRDTLRSIKMALRPLPDKPGSSKM